MIDNNISTFFVFKFLVFGYFTNPVFWPNLEKIALKIRSRNNPKTKNLKTKNVENVIFYLLVGPPKNSNQFLAFFSHFYPISLDNFALTTKTRPPQFTRNQILTPTGK